MSTRRVQRLNSLLKEVIAEVLKKDVKNPSISEFSTVTRVNITKDLHYAKVYISILGEEETKTTTIDALNTASGFIATRASKKVVLRYFPSLTFILDDSTDKHLRVEELLTEIEQERLLRENQEEQPHEQQPPKTTDSRNPADQ